MNDEHRKERLRHLIATDYGKQVDFVRATGLNKARVSQMAGTKEPFGEEAARRLAAELRLPADWFNLSLPTPKEKSRGLQLIESAPPGEPIPRSSFRKIWVVGKGSGGLMPERIWTDSDIPVGAGSDYAELGSSDPDAFLSEVIGQSMYPKYEHKNFALIEPNTSIDLEDCVLVRLDSGETLLKRLLSRRNGSITLGSFNDSGVIHIEDIDITWMYYAAHEVPRKKIKSRF
ncbi:hypothetical protein KDK82_2317 [Delftia sp. K82]|uniref:S24 family peptidase n=1 Tax=Delftia sp. K82 TaxID=1472718 RepID=UPI000B490CCA|nr:S24 family peptidase [Delftia sp. K82]OWG18837.1 hypothetical protein KDK82_2317 [Delftia sp. K82]